MLASFTRHHAIEVNKETPGVDSPCPNCADSLATRLTGSMSKQDVYTNSRLWHE